MKLATVLCAELDNQLAEIARLDEAVERFLACFEVPTPNRFQLNLILEELLTNTIKYGYADDGAHIITVRLELEADAIDLRIEDDGAAFNPFDRPPVDVSTPIEEREIGGLGIHIVQELAQEVHYERLADRNVTRLKLLIADEQQALSEQG